MRIPYFPPNSDGRYPLYILIPLMQLPTLSVALRRDIARQVAERTRHLSL